MIDRLIIYFLVYSFLGYLSEVAYCSIGQHRLVNRGFLYGPWLPIYGFGGLLVVIFLDPVSQWPPLVFVLAFLLTSLLEYFTSWALERLFSVKLWDYSRMKVNINGRVCLLNSTLFGIMGLALEYVVYPPLSDAIDRIPLMILHYTAYLIAIVMSVDATLSVIKMKSFKDGLERIHAARRRAEEKIRALEGEGKAELAAELRSRLEQSIAEAAEEFKERSRHIVLANPTMTAKSEELRHDIAVLSSWVRERRELRRKYKEDLPGDDQHSRIFHGFHKGGYRGAVRPGR